MEENVRVKTKKSLPIFVVWFVIGILVGAGALFAWNFYTTKNQAKVATQAQQAQVKDIIAKVSKLILLPTGEDPVVATINDAATLSKDQAFYKGSKNGDIVLVYQKAAKAVIYSPDRNIIVNVGPIYSQDQQSQTSN
jgi:hypothetical protein